MFRALVTCKATIGQKQAKQKQAATTSISTPNLNKFFTPSNACANPGSPQQPVTIDVDDDESGAGEQRNKLTG